MGGQAESITPCKPKASEKPGASAKSSFNGLRKHLNGNEVHFHDDSKGLKFVWPDKDTFRIYWKQFVATIGRMEEGDRCAFIGEPNRVKSQKAGVLVWEKLNTGELELYIEEYDPEKVYEHEIRKNDALEDIDIWVQENC